MLLGRFKLVHTVQPCGWEIERRQQQQLASAKFLRGPLRLACIACIPPAHHRLPQHGGGGGGLLLVRVIPWPGWRRRPPRHPLQSRPLCWPCAPPRANTASVATVQRDHHTIGSAVCPISPGVFSLAGVVRADQHDWSGGNRRVAFKPGKASWGTAKREVEMQLLQMQPHSSSSNSNSKSWSARWRAVLRPLLPTKLHRNLFCGAPRGLLEPSAHIFDPNRTRLRRGQLR